VNKRTSRSDALVNRPALLAALGTCRSAVIRPGDGTLDETG